MDSQVTELWGVGRSFDFFCRAFFLIVFFSSGLMVEFGPASIDSFLRRYQSQAKTLVTLPDGLCRVTIFNGKELLCFQDFSSADVHEAFLDGLNENKELLETEEEFKAANAELFAQAQVLSRKNKELLAKNKELAAKNKELTRMMQAVRDLTQQFDDSTNSYDSDKSEDGVEEPEQEEEEVIVKRPPKRRNTNAKVVNKPKKPKNLKPKSLKPKRAPCFQVRWTDAVLAEVRTFLVEHKDGDYAWLASAINDVKYNEGETPSTIKGFPEEFQKAWANFKQTACWGIFTAALFPDKVLLLEEKLAKFRESQIPAKASEEDDEDSAQEEELNGGSESD
jgi:uncharacterized coiled-coil protein SlyX